MRNEIIKLITTTAQGTQLYEERIEVFAEEKSVVRAEFYGAYQVGLNPKHTFIIDSLDYELSRKVIDSVETYAQEVEYNGAKFTIIRSYDDGVDAELIVG